MKRNLLVLTVLLIVFMAVPCFAAAEKESSDGSIVVLAQDDGPVYCEGILKVWKTGKVALLYESGEAALVFPKKDFPKKLARMLYRAGVHQEKVTFVVSPPEQCDCNVAFLIHDNNQNAKFKEIYSKYNNQRHAALKK